MEEAFDLSLLWWMHFCMLTHCCCGGRGLRVDLVAFITIVVASIQVVYLLKNVSRAKNEKKHTSTQETLSSSLGAFFPSPFTLVVVGPVVVVVDTSLLLW